MTYKEFVEWAKDQEERWGDHKLKSFECDDVGYKVTLGINGEFVTYSRPVSRIHSK